MGLNNPLGERFLANVVCFCDIPVEDLEIHMSKYSRFGLSLLKDFLIERGASPVFYVDTSADLPGPLPEFHPLQPVSREQIFDWGTRACMEVLQAAVSKPWTDNEDDQRRVMTVQSFLLSHVLAFLKPFDASHVDDDPTNYYMEREWRVHGSVDFTIDDVHRVFVPAEYATRLREALPEYVGQVTFV